MQFFPTIPHAPGEPISDLPKFPIRLAVNFVDFGDCEGFGSLLECGFLTRNPDSGIPKSTLAVYTVMGNKAPQGVQWVRNQLVRQYD